MLFITNRQPLTPNQPHFIFDLNQNAPSNQLYFCQRHRQGMYEEIGHHALIDQLKQSQRQGILFFIHGYNNLPEDSIFNHARALEAALDENIDVVPIIWPCDNDLGQIKDYYDDQQSADDSGTAFARGLQKFLSWQDREDPCAKRMHILAHSMGNRVLRQTLTLWQERFVFRGVPMLFRHIFMVAADVVNDTLSYRNAGNIICQATHKLHVLYAADDLALRGSKIANLKHGIAARRLGHTGVENIDQVPANVVQLNCDGFNNKQDRLGHTYFLHPKVTGYLLDQLTV